MTGTSKEGARAAQHGSPATQDAAATDRRASLTDPGMPRADMHVEDAILSRRSIRAFLPKPVPQKLLRRLLEVARWAPSGSNIQPWRVHVLTGRSLTALSEAMIAAARAGEPRDMQYHYYAPQWREPFLTRRRACGFGLYGAMGIDRGDMEGRRVAFERNYFFFGAPAGMLFWIGRELEHGSWLDYGTFIHSISLAARGFGLSTIAQGALGEYPHVAHKMFGIGDDHILIGGMSIGWPDPDAPVNGFQPDRTPVDDFATWMD
jgi:nitroreductase